MVSKILCVAEKPSIAKAVAYHLGHHVTRTSATGAQFIQNYEFDFTFSQPWGSCQVVMTSVVGHIVGHDFGPNHRSWNSCAPLDLFEAPIEASIHDDKKAVAKNIEKQARYAKALFIWTDCDREGEHIGAEIRDIALKINSRLEVRRARFSNIEKNHVVHAARNPVQLDENQAQAVAARIELDLRIGASFTRMQTKSLKPMIEHLQELGAISYGSCQFPTLGFVVDRYFRVQKFVPETFWKLQVFHERDGIRVTFNWRRVHLFDRGIVIVLFERCLDARIAKVTKLQTKPTSKWRPLPLTTVELQKMGSRFLRMDSQRIMKIAEDLYQKGYISYPRTETDQFDKDMDLRKIVETQTPNSHWGNYAQNLLSGAYRTPRNGPHNDKAHPPIHPVAHADSSALSGDDWRVYEFVTRRFLACCSEDAHGSTTTVELTLGSEAFSAHGLIVLERNYLDVYPYDKWESSTQLPKFVLNETFIPSEVKMSDGRTQPPGYLTEPELIALMDANGIGTDATMAEHIAKIKERSYVKTQSRGSGGAGAVDSDEESTELASTTRGRGRGRGRGARGGRANGTSARGGGSNGMQEFIPTTLGVALIEGYDGIGLETSLSKPFLRKEMEQQMKAICEGHTTKNDVVQLSLEQYRAVFLRTQSEMATLKTAVRKYVLGQPTPQAQQQPHARARGPAQAQA